MAEEEVYEACLTWHAFNWLENHRSMNRAVYLELHAGPIMGSIIQIHGLQNVIDDFIAKTVSER